MFKSFTSLLTLLLLSFNVNAVQQLSITSVKFTGDAYIDTSVSHTRAVGRISTINQDGGITYNYGDNNEYGYFIVDGVSPSTITQTGPVNNFSAYGGSVYFYKTNVDVFDTTLNFADLTSAIINNGYVYMEASVDGSILGITTSVSYAANGFLSVVSNQVYDNAGASVSYDGSVFDTNSRLNFDGTYSDLSFALVGSVNNNNPLVNSDYGYIVSADMQGAAPTTVPLPAGILLLMSGLLGLVKFKKS